MSQITERQRQIIKFIREHENDEVKLSEIIEKFNHWYYHNSRKHISDIMYRMVKSKKLIKPKRGYYKLNDEPVWTTPEDKEVDPDQLNMFE